MHKITDTTCPKCGHTVHGVHYVLGGDMDIYSKKMRHAGQLKRVCGTCGYYWYQDSLDNIEKAVSESVGEKV